MREHHDQPHEVAALNESSRGRWLITTKRTQHIWDCDNGTYQRVPGLTSKRMEYDGETVAIGRVTRWPRLGATFLFWFDDPLDPDLLEHWRQSSPIESIVRAADREGNDDADGDELGLSHVRLPETPED
jgi:hypothetical protein